MSNTFFGGEGEYFNQYDVQRVRRKKQVTTITFTTGRKVTLRGQEGKVVYSEFVRRIVNGAGQY